MSLHRKPLTRLEEDGLRAHGLDIGTPSQLSDVFRQGVAWALAQPRLEVHLNAADKLPPVDCPLLIEVMKGYLVLAQRTGIIENKRAAMEYRLVTGETIQGRFRWTYP